MQQYEDAVKLHKAGKPVDLEELPCPPGWSLSQLIFGAIRFLLAVVDRMTLLLK